MASGWDWLTRMFTKSDSDSQSGDAYNRAYQYAQEQNTPHWVDILTGDQRDVYNRMKQGVMSQYNQPLNADTLNAINQYQDLANWYANQRASFTPGVIDPNVRAGYLKNLNQDFYGYGNQPGAKALAEEQFAGTGGYWGSARPQGIMNTYESTVSRPLNTWDINALQNSYQNALNYAQQGSSIANANVQNQLLSRKAEDQNFQNALQFMGIQTQAENVNWMNPATFAESQRKTAGTGGAGGMVGGGIGGVLGAVFGGPAGAGLGYQLGSGIGGGFDTQPQAYDQFGNRPETPGYNWMSPLSAYAGAAGGSMLGSNLSNYNAVSGGNNAFSELRDAILSQGNAAKIRGIY